MTASLRREMISWNSISTTLIFCGVLALSQASSCNAVPVAPLEETLTVSIDTFPIVQKLQDLTSNINNAAPANVLLANGSPLELEERRNQFQEMYKAAQRELQTLSQDVVPELQTLQQQLQDFDEAVIKATNVNGKSPLLAKREPRRLSNKIEALAK
ncbi:hypothetical protein HK102_008166, partial [Quaeritorhiza haematococci]